MAHVEKFKLHAIAHMLEHYARIPELERGYERDNIDPGFTVLNYKIGGVDDPGETIREAIELHKEMSGRAIRSDANVMATWVITQPRDLPDFRNEEFFQNCYDFVAERYGEENVLGGYVHMDETTPHIHVAFMPRDDDMFRAKTVINRQDLRSFHDDLSRYIEQQMGQKYAVTLSPEQTVERELYQTRTLEQYKQVKDEIRNQENTYEQYKQVNDRNLEVLNQQKQTIEQVNERLEYLRRSCEQQEQRIGQLDERIVDAREAIERVRSTIGEQRATIGKQELDLKQDQNDRSQLGHELRQALQHIDRGSRELKQGSGELRERVGELRQAIGERQERMVGIVRDNERFRERSDSARGRSASAGERIERAEKQTQKVKQDIGKLRNGIGRLRERLGRCIEHLQQRFKPERVRDLVRGQKLAQKDVGRSIAREVSRAIGDRIEQPHDYGYERDDYEFDRHMNM